MRRFWYVIWVPYITHLLYNNNNYNVLNIEPMSPDFKQWASNTNMCAQIQKYGGSADLRHACAEHNICCIYIYVYIYILIQSSNLCQTSTLSIYPSPISCFTTAKAQPLRQWGFWSHFFFMSSTLSAQRPQTISTTGAKGDCWCKQTRKIRWKSLVNSWTNWKANSVDIDANVWFGLECSQIVCLICFL